MHPRKLAKPPLPSGTPKSLFFRFPLATYSSRRSRDSTLPSSSSHRPYTLRVAGESDFDTNPSSSSHFQASRLDPTPPCNMTKSRTPPPHSGVPSSLEQSTQVPRYCPATVTASAPLELNRNSSRVVRSC